MVSGGDEIGVMGTWRSEEKDDDICIWFLGWFYWLAGDEIGFEMGFLIVIVNGYEMVDQREGEEEGWKMFREDRPLTKRKKDK